MKEKKLDRNFISKTGVSKHLMCIICQDIFDDPVRINCGHTFCSECLEQWLNDNSSCPTCRVKSNRKMFGKDLIAFNIINDMQVACINKDCPWKSTLSELENHIKYCFLDEKKIPDYLKNKLKDNNNNVKNVEDNEVTADDYLNFNSSSNLYARLYAKNKDLMNNALEERKEEERDLLDILKGDKNEDVDINCMENVNPNNLEGQSLQRKRGRKSTTMKKNKRKSNDAPLEEEEDDDELKNALMLSLLEN